MSAEAPAHGEAVPKGRLAPVARPEGRRRPHPVMLLQGIVRSRLSLGRMARGLADAGFEVYNLGGPSPRLPLEAQIARFRRDLERLGCEPARLHDGAPLVMHGVGHSTATSPDRLGRTMRSATGVRPQRRTQASSFYVRPGNAPALPPFVFRYRQQRPQGTSVSVASL